MCFSGFVNLYLQPLWVFARKTVHIHPATYVKILPNNECSAQVRDKEGSPSQLTCLPFPSWDCGELKYGFMLDLCSVSCLAHFIVSDHFRTGNMCLLPYAGLWFLHLYVFGHTRQLRFYWYQLLAVGDSECIKQRTPVLLHTLP